MEQFHYHPRCRGAKLAHLCFADNLILCCKREFNSIYIMLQAFKLFYDTSGLKANIQKSSFYSCAMSEEDV